MLPRRTRTIEDKAYTISYLQYGSYASYGPTYDSRSATISKEDSDLLFKTQPMESVPELEQVLKLGEMEEIDYIVNRAIGDDKKAQEILDKTVDVKPDPLALLSLEKEGIDVSFLKAFDPSQEIKEDISVEEIQAQRVLARCMASNHDTFHLPADCAEAFGENATVGTVAKKTFMDNEAMHIKKCAWKTSSPNM